jgi:capsular exopolysaccharide synthesis family protein
MQTLFGAPLEPAKPERPANSFPEGTGPLGDLTALPGSGRTISTRLNSSAPIFPFDEAHWRASEQYRIIRTKLVQHPLQPRLMVVSSAAPGDGKTITAANMAAVMALKNESTVLLVDGDLRRASLAPVLGVASSPGLSDVLAGVHTLPEVIVRLEPFPNLYFLPAGKDRSSPSELLDSPGWKAAAEQLRRDFKYVFVDAPPIGMVADYDLLQAVCDAVIVVVRPEHTNRTQFFQALRTVPAEKLAGIVVNCAQESFLWKSHGYYYYYY